MPTAFLLITRIVLEILAARLNNAVVDYGASALRIYSAAKFLYESESGQPLDESKVPPFVPIP